MQTSYAYMNTERWQAILRTGAELAPDELTTDPGRQLDEGNRVRLVVAVPAVVSTSACADGARATAAAAIAARTHGLPNLIAVLRDSSHPAQAAEWSPLLSDRERGSQQPAAGRRGGGRLVATRTSARAAWRSTA